MSAKRNVRTRNRTKTKIKALQLLHDRATRRPAEWGLVKSMRGNDLVEINAMWIDKLPMYQMSDLFPMARLGLMAQPRDTVVPMEDPENDIKAGDEIEDGHLFLIDLDGTDIVQYAVRLE